jgi:4-amino-4-deoxy-L-arabinose transferase-like glycosyltransferase
MTEEAVDAAPEGGRRRLRIGEWRLLCLILLLFALRNIPWRLDDSGQAKQAFVSLEMVQAGHWWFQHLPGSKVMATKPPLVGWCSAAVYAVTGDWEIAWRLPSLLSAVAILALLWRAGERLWPEQGGPLAAGAFALNLLTPRLAMLVGTQMPLALCTTLLGLFVWRHVRDAKPWTAGARGAVFLLLLAALMTKGPVVYAFLLPGMIAYPWLSRKLGLSGGSAWGGWLHWALPLLPFLFWLERGMVTMPGFYQEVIAQAAVHPDEKFYFYFVQLLALWLPWSVLLLAVRARVRGAWNQLFREPGTLWLACWAAGGLLCLSCAPAKSADRILPALVPLCLVLTAALAQAKTRSGAMWPQVWGRATLWIAAGLALGVAIWQVSGVYRRHENALAAFGEQARERTAGARCELVETRFEGAHDEAMLVYLRRLTWLDPAQAVQLNSVGKLDWIVASDAALTRAAGPLGRFHPADPLQTSGQEGYALLKADTPLR